MSTQPSVDKKKVLKAGPPVQLVIKKEDKPPNMEKIMIARSNKEVESNTEFGTFRVLSSDYIGKVFLKGQHYEADNIKRVLSLLNEGDVVVDVGANFGIHTIPYAQKVGPKGVVHAFEPQGVIFNLLTDNVKLNVPKHDVRLYHEAVGHQVCETSMSGYCDQGRIVDYHRSQQTNYGGMCLGKDGEKIRMISIDSLELERCNFIKIDVEGSERMVIYGARDTINRLQPIVLFEENRKKITEEMIQMYDLSNNIVNFDIRDFFLKEMGYSTCEKMGSNYLMLP